ncbi:MAG: ROK family protein [Myxococcales bacterium]
MDLGGTKIEVVVLTPEGAQLHRERVPTPAGDYDAIVETITALVTSAERCVGAHCTVGVATPGALSPATGMLRNANTTCLNGRPLDRDLSDSLQRTVKIANDANCFALSEAVDGAGRDADVVFGVIVGTGTGGGIVVSRRVLEGAHCIAGEWGHNPLPWPKPDELPGPECYCGKRGCIETFLSGPGLARDYRAAGGEHLEAAAIAVRADGGEALAVEALQRHADRMARALSTVINVLDPDTIVVGGGISRIESLYGALAAHLPAHVFSDRVTTPIVPALHGDSSGVRGAAWLWPGPGEAR